MPGMSARIAIQRRWMTSWIKRRQAFVEEVKAMIKKGYGLDSIIAELGKKGIARRTAIEYYSSASIK